MANKIIAANWKMNLMRDEAVSLLEGLKNYFFVLNRFLS